MKLSLSLVAVKKISSTKPRSEFIDDELEKAAQLILESEGVINPIVVRRTSLQSYEVVDGDFEYYAALRAKEIDIRKGEMIGVFIIEDENQDNLTRQVEFFRKSKNIVPINNGDIRMTNIESRVTNIESRYDKRINELQNEIKREFKNINEKLKELENNLPKQIEPLYALNNLSIQELTSKLKRANVQQKVIDSLINERRNNGNFKSFDNVIKRVEGLGDKTMLKIIDSFNQGSV